MRGSGERQVLGIGARGLSALLMLITGVVEATAQGHLVCPQTGTSRAAVANIDERLEITLKDGRTLRLVGLEPPRPTPDAPDFDITARDALRAKLGREIAFVTLAENPDRWGRLPAFVFTGALSAGSTAEFLLENGFARFMPEPEARACRTSFLVAEETARAAKLGLWGDPFYAIITATDEDAFAERAATNVIVEGRLVAVDKGPLRSYLQFVPQPQRGFEVTLLQRNVKLFEQAGFDFDALIGRRLRVRGLLDLRFGPQIEISSPDEIELIPEARDDRGLEHGGSDKPQ
jgi:endonuclease YncB( thermonuclease family)